MTKARKITERRRGRRRRGREEAKRETWLRDPSRPTRTQGILILVLVISLITNYMTMDITGYISLYKPRANSKRI